METFKHEFAVKLARSIAETMDIFITLIVIVALIVIVIYVIATGIVNATFGALYEIIAMAFGLASKITDIIFPLIGTIL